MIKGDNLSFGFRDRELFSRISFSLEQDRHCALIGSNGTGKTTLTELIRHPEDYIYEGRILRENTGRIGHVRQFAVREGEQTMTVLDYLRADFLCLQQKIDAVCAEMAAEEADQDRLMARYQQLLDESSAMDADNSESNIHRQLHLAELSDKALLELGKLSGGEYKLVQVIRQMLRRPGLLIMDEPDVFLDVENLTGLRDLINAYRGTLLVVTHNRYLLNHCFDQIWHLENSGLAEYDGNFPAYAHARLQKKIQQQLSAAADTAEICRMEEVVERLRDEATQVISAQKGRTLKGKVSHLNRLLARRTEVPFLEVRCPEIGLPACADTPAGETLLQVTDYSLAFRETLLAQVSFSLAAGEKVALVGPNGTGKTSMLRQIHRGDHPAITVSANAKTAFFSQLHREVFREESTICEIFFDAGFKSREEIQAYLKGYCFAPDSLHRKVGHLSGGEKNLLQLALLALGESNLLLLDEPSSHLDTFAQKALEEALRAWPGAVLMVSHDVYTVANCADRVLLVEGGTVRPMRVRAFRKMIGKHHFSHEYLLLEQQKKELETQISHCLQEGDCAKAQRLCDKLGDVVRQM